MSTLKHIVAVIGRRTLKIQIGGVSKVFASQEEFVRFLKARLAVPGDRLEEFARLGERALQREARKMLHAHQNVMDVMVSAKESGESIANLWRRLDISKVPDDHDWPSILFTLGNAQHVAEDYRREALAQYLRFLETRRDALDGFRQHQERSGGSEPSLTAAPSRAGMDEVSAPSATAVLEKYSRLPHCHTVEVDMDEKPDITLFLGTNRYRLAKRGGVVLFKESEAGSAYPLKVGRNTIGRSSECDIHLNHVHTDVSRQHLIVEISENRRINLMDVSSRGTYVRPELLASTRSDTVTEQQG